MLLSPRTPPLPPSFFCSSYPFELGRKAGPIRSEILRLCSRALAIKRQPITIVIVVVITVVISKWARASERASAENFTGSSAAREPWESIDTRCSMCWFFPFLHSDKKKAAINLIIAIWWWRFKNFTSVTLIVYIELSSMLAENFIVVWLLNFSWKSFTL